MTVPSIVDLDKIKLWWPQHTLVREIRLLNDHLEERRKAWEVCNIRQCNRIIELEAEVAKLKEEKK
mgnify:FL=1